MADIVVTAARVAAIFPEKAETFDMIAAEAIVKGEAVYQTAAGKAAASGGASAGVAQFMGIALNKASAGMAVSVLKKGLVAGFTLTSQAYGAPIYLSATAGSLADAAATVATVVGRVVPLPDKDLTKALFVESNMAKIWA
jgi:hypothetical protein